MRAWLRVKGTLEPVLKEGSLEQDAHEPFTSNTAFLQSDISKGILLKLRLFAACCGCERSQDPFPGRSPNADVERMALRKPCPQPLFAGSGTPGFPLLSGKGTSSWETSHNPESLKREVNCH